MEFIMYKVRALPDRTLKFAGHVPPDCTKSKLKFFLKYYFFLYKFLGALEDRYALPGVRFQKPFITEMREITIRPTTRTMEDINTVTKDGIEIVFHGIQVLSSVDLSQLLGLVKKFGSEFRRVLIYDRVSEDLRLFCANHTIDEVIWILIQIYICIYENSNEFCTWADWVLGQLRKFLQFC